MKRLFPLLSNKNKMVSVAYSHRLLCDANFLSWLSEQLDKEILLSNLIHIKSSSQYWKKTHNLILKNEAEDCNANEKINEKYIGASFKITEEPNFLSGYNENIVKNIIFAMDLTDEPPYRCYLLTSPEKEREYLSNKHYEEITSVKILSGDKARKIIKDFFRAFCIQRDIQRM